jgi:molybdenum cofactor biosynthesis enzyme MoaA
MANKDIFCNTPWYEAHIYWDGSFGICCQESRKLYNSIDTTYNIHTMTLAEWFNSEPVKQLRLDVLSDTATDICSRCYNEESVCGSSRRHKSNQKSVIFTRTAFIDSYQQSPGYKHFEHSRLQAGKTTTQPIDLHIDLGNYCNLACKMCWSGASSKIATQYVKWGHADHKQYLGLDWTKNKQTWDRFLNELLAIPKLQNIHLMGGETLLTGRFEELVDFLTAHNRFDVCFSFVTNGTKFNEPLINKLKKFTRVGIEVSIETVTAHNDYVRQGTDTTEVLKNIQKYIQHCNNTSISLTIRPAISALTIGYYYTLLEYCLENKLIIKSLLVTTPAYLNVNVLPYAIKQKYLQHYTTILSSLSEVNINNEYNESDPNNYKKSIKQQAIQIINILNSPSEHNQDLATELVTICKQWDTVYKFDAKILYPELTEVLTQYGY